MVYAGLSALTAALVAILGKMGLQSVNPTIATTLRGVIMAVFLLVVTTTTGAWRGFSWAQLSQKDGVLLILAALAGASSWLFYFLALKTGDATRVAAIDRLSIVGVVLLAAIILGDALNLRSLAGAILIAAGTILVVFH